MSSAYDTLDMEHLKSALNSNSGVTVIIIAKSYGSMSERQ